MNKYLRNICLIAAIAFLVGCNKNSVETQASFDPILAVVRANADALNREDLSAAIALMHPDSPGLQQTKEMSEKLFQAYDLRYTVKDLAVESVTGDEAKVRFSQVTEKLSGPAFRNNRVDGIHILKKQNGEWKLYNTQVTKIEYLDK